MPDTKSPKGLGKGLSALIAEINDETPRGNLATGGQLTMEIPINHIDPSPYQPRHYFANGALKDLIESIQKNGVLQPIIVRERGGRYELVAGERRWRAGTMARLKTIPAIIKVLSDKQALEIALVENIHRQDLTPLEEAQGYHRLMEEFSYTQEVLSLALKKSRSHVANMLRLLTLPDDVKRLLDKGQISIGHARALVGLEDAVSVADEIIRSELSVRQTEQLIKDRANPTSATTSTAVPRSKPVTAPAKAKDDDIIGLEKMLSEAMGLAVSIEDHGNNGRVIIAFNSLEQLDKILQKLGQ